MKSIQALETIFLVKSNKANKQKSGPESQLYHLLAVWLQANHLTSFIILRDNNIQRCTDKCVITNLLNKKSPDLKWLHFCGINAPHSKIQATDIDAIECRVRKSCTVSHHYFHHTDTININNLKSIDRPGTVTHICNLSTLGGKDRSIP